MSHGKPIYRSAIKIPRASLQRDNLKKLPLAEHTLLKGTSYFRSPSVLVPRDTEEA
jgi:hypothetical protein